MTDITAQSDPLAPAAGRAEAASRLEAPTSPPSALAVAYAELETIRRGLDVVAELLALNPGTDHAHLVLGVLRERALAAEVAARAACELPSGQAAAAAVVPLRPPAPGVTGPADDVDPAAPYLEIGNLALALRETLWNALADDDGWIDTVQSAASVAAHIGYLADAGARAQGMGGQFANGDGWFMGPATRAAVGRASE